MQVLKSSAVWIFVLAMIALAGFSGLTLARALLDVASVTSDSPIALYRVRY